jgi:hypothetical protein
MHYETPKNHADESSTLHVLELTQGSLAEADDLFCFDFDTFIC